ncbi:MAG: non-ribosomal peptide synthetase, partial [Cyclobacteriaceae bacterium]
TPAFLEYLAETPGFGSKNTLKRIFSGGEALTTKLADKLSRLTSAKVINLYGPTECTVDATFHEYNRQTDTGKIVPIGRPIDNMTAYVLDDSGNQVPEGIPGELHFAGAGLAIGYHNQPELTETTFFKPDFLPVSRLYKTGDLVKTDYNGVLHYLGRKDHQLKLRGVRIEAAEIENIMAGHPEVKQSVVVLKGGKMVGYYTSGTQPDHSALRKYTTGKLPVYMVPALFVKIDSIPFTTGGKVNRKKLTSLPLPESLEQTVAPEDELESKIFSIWSKALKTDRFGTTDNFFSIGGHSLAGIHILSDINHELQIDITLKELFDSSTIKALCELIRIKLETAVFVEAEDIISSFGEDSEELIL